MTRHSSFYAARRRVLQALAVTAAAGSIPLPLRALDPAASSTDRKLDVLVVAPHSDDEAIGCTTVMLRAIKQQQRVGCLIVTAGDGFPKAAAALAKKEMKELTPEDYLALANLRQRHSIQAMKRIGLDPADLLFLGYPDGGLATLYAAKDDAVYRQPFTGKTATYGAETADYHTSAHARPAPYQRSAVLSDLTEIIKARAPAEIYVTGASDTHGDHSATFAFVRDAAKAAGYRGPLWTYIVHGRPPAEPADRRLELTEAERKAKRALLELYQSGVSPVHDDLAETYAKPEEAFWAVRMDP